MSQQQHSTTAMKQCIDGLLCSDLEAHPLFGKVLLPAVGSSY
jgi:hypothetical protein